MPLLEVIQIVACYGSSVAINGASFQTEKGERIALLGANGAGKSSVVNAISGMLRLRSGEIWFKGHRLDGTPPHQVVHRGISQIPEGRLIFPKMTVWENLELGATILKDAIKKKKLYDEILQLFPRLRERQDQQAGTMSGGEQQMLAVGRALMSRPEVILSDEISMGLAPIVVRDIYETLTRINEEWGVTLVMVEQEARLALKVAQSCHLLESGRIVVSGSAEEMSKSEVIRKVYLAED